MGPEEDDDKFDVDLGKLQARLHTAEEADTLYWLQNDTKLRAVQQHCTYEEFRQLVNSAHLQPLNGGDQLQRMAERRATPWNSVTTGTKDLELPGCSKEEEGEEEVAPTARSPQEFSRLWRSQSPSQRSRMLSSLGPSGLTRLFVSELPSALFSEVAASLCAPDAPPEAVPLLLALTSTRGFQRGLCAHFLSEELRGQLRALLEPRREEGCVREAWSALRL